MSQTVRHINLHDAGRFFGFRIFSIKYVKIF